MPLVVANHDFRRAPAQMQQHGRLAEQLPGRPAERPSLHKRQRGQRAKKEPVLDSPTRPRGRQGVQDPEDPQLLVQPYQVVQGPGGHRRGPVGPFPPPQRLDHRLVIVTIPGLFHGAILPVAPISASSSHHDNPLLRWFPVLPHPMHALLYLQTSTRRGLESPWRAAKL